MKKNEGELKVKILLMVFCLIAAAVFTLMYFSRSAIPDKVGRELTEKEIQGIMAENSKMISYIKLSPNADFPREDKIRKITIHHMGGDYSLEQLGREFSFRDREASANYGIDSNGNVGLFVEEKDRSWASSDEDNDQQAVTIEVANDENGGEWHVNDKAFDALVQLCTDICRRNNIEELVFTGDEEGNLTCHNMFSNDTICPGPYLESRMGDIAQLVNKNLGSMKGEKNE